MDGPTYGPIDKASLSKNGQDFMDKQFNKFRFVDNETKSSHFT